MSFDIQISDLTNSTTASDGTGIYDVLMHSVVRHIESQYERGSLSGTDYANVYLGSMQSVLAESVRFILQEKQSGEQAALIAEQVKSEVKNNETGGIIDQQKKKLQEEIDLIIAQTANQYEQVAFSQADTSRRNLLNAQNVIKTEKETTLIVRQESEMALNGTTDRAFTVERTIATTSGGLDNTNKTNADVALINAQELKVDEETLLVTAQHTKLSGVDTTLTTSQNAKVVAEELLVDAQVSKVGKENLLITEQTSKVTAEVAEIPANATSQRGKMDAETTLLGSRNTEQIAATIRLDDESAKRILLMQAQTTGFKTDAKQKLMRQLYEGYAVNVTTLGEVTGSPTGATASALDAVANDILDDLGSGVNI